MASITMVGSGSTGKGTPSSTTRCYPRPQCRNHPVPARIGFSRAASLTRSSASVRGVGGREAHRIKPTTSRASVFRGTIWTFSGTSAGSMVIVTSSPPSKGHPGGGTEYGGAEALQALLDGRRAPGRGVRSDHDRLQTSRWWEGDARYGSPVSTVRMF